LSEDETEPGGELESVGAEKPAESHAEPAPPAAGETGRDRLWERQPTESVLSGVRWPLLAFLLLLVYALFVFAPGSVEGVVRERVRSRLKEQWLGFATVAVSGQSVVLRGTPPRAGDAERALLLTERTTCPTLFGELDCTVDVRGEFEPPAAVVAPPTPPERVEPAGGEARPAPSDRPSAAPRRKGDAKKAQKG
jgi:hypothetical protein